VAESNWLIARGGYLSSFRYELALVSRSAVLRWLVNSSESLLSSIGSRDGIDEWIEKLGDEMREDGLVGRGVPAVARGRREVGGLKDLAGVTEVRS